VLQDDSISRHVPALHHSSHQMNLKLVLLSAFFMLISVHQIYGQSIVAHRGSSYEAPENTLSAFNLAWEQGADAIEGDFHLTADHQIVCIHDRTTERTAPEQPIRNIADVSFAELNGVDVGSWKSPQFKGEPIPTLANVLATVPDKKKIFVEIKCGVEIVPHLVKSLADSKLNENQVVIISFSKDFVQAVRNALPQHKCNWLTGYKDDNAEKEWRPSNQVVLEALKKAAATGLGSQFNQQVIGQPFVDSLRKPGFEFHVWKVDDPAEMKAAINLEVDSITTNRPDIAKEIRDQTKPELNNHSPSKIEKQ
jgi:glycerophosphoryl diester phosphodiesterase